MRPIILTLLITTLFFFILGGFFVIYPMRARDYVSGLPRNIWLGRILTAVALIWSAFLVYQEHFGLIDKNIWLLFILPPLIFTLVIKYMDELLSARAIGGILVLLPAPMLDSVFTIDSPKRLFVTILAYILALAGMVIIWSPYLLRKWLNPCVKHIRGAGIMAIVLGLLYGVLFILFLIE